MFTFHLPLDSSRTNTIAGESSSSQPSSDTMTNPASWKTHLYQPDFDFAIYVPHVKHEKKIHFYGNAQFIADVFVVAKLNFIEVLCMFYLQSKIA